jgi:esterase/lipase
MRNQIVIFIHGYRSKSKIFKRIAKNFNENEISNINYDFDNENINDIFKKIDRVIEDNMESDLNFICHSMGGLILNNYLQKKNIEIKNIFYISTPINLSKKIVKNSPIIELLEKPVIYKNKIKVINSYLLEENKNSYEKYGITGLNEKNDGVINLLDTVINGVTTCTIKGKDHFWILFDKDVSNFINTYFM